MNKEPYTILFFGRSGSGKGTQADMLTSYLKQTEFPVKYLETGEKFREILNTDSFTSRKIKKIIEGGGLLPIFLPISVWTIFFKENLDIHDHLILDGLCRRPEEAIPLDQAFKFYERKNVHIIYLETGREWATKRLIERGRSDDSTEYIKKRQEWFDWQVIPAISFFHEHQGYRFHLINGEQSVEKVSRDIIEAINS